MASFTVELKDAEMARVQAAMAIGGQPATLAQLASACVDFLESKVLTVEKSEAIADAVSKVPPLDKQPPLPVKA